MRDKIQGMSAWARHPIRGGVEITPVWGGCVKMLDNLGTLTTNAAGQLNVLGHDGDTLGVDSS